MELYLSEDILKEYEEVLKRPKFGFSQKLIREFIKEIRTKAKIIKPEISLDVLPDPDDNKFLECATSGKVDYLVTGNTRHFPKVFQGIQIVTPREFWEIYKESIFTS